jgi:hypothetical protein
LAGAVCGVGADGAGSEALEVEEGSAAGRAAGALAGVLSAGSARSVAGHTGGGVQTGN